MEETLNKLTKKELIELIIKLNDSNDSNKGIVDSVITTIAAKKGNDAMNNDDDDNSKKKVKRQFDMSKYRQRHIALQVQYDGCNYIGFASQSGHNNDNTIEKHLFDALIKVKLIENRTTCKYTRCGRTDKGVSALGQVISLYLRSNLPLYNDTINDNDNDDDDNPPKKRKTDNDNTIVQEIDYCGMLNKVLPVDIRIIGWNEVSENFSSRFSATYRKYRYFFVKRNLNIDAMNEAARYLIGDHDFRNLCKMDVVNVTNFRREIYEANVVPFIHNEEDSSRSVWMLEIRGIAFLWHMVRCIMAILLLVGEGKEEPTIVRELLDIENCPSKPFYEMACDQPLVLYECGFDNLKLEMHPNNLYNLTNHYESIWQHHLISAARAMNALEYIKNINVDASSVEDFIKFINEKMKRKQYESHSITIDNSIINDNGTMTWKNAYNMISPHYIEPYKQLMSRSRGQKYDDRKEQLNETKKEKLKRHEDLQATKDPLFFEKMRSEGNL